jgi:hypothetical protein
VATRRPDPFERAIIVVPVVAAVVAAALVLVIRWLVKDEWFLLDFAEDLIRNLLVGGILAAAVYWLEKRRREAERRATLEAASRRHRQQVLRLKELVQLAASGWSPLDIQPTATDDEALRGMREEIDEFRGIADQLEKMHERKPDDVERVFDFQELKFLIDRYLSEGSRERRFEYLDYLLLEVSSIEGAEDDPLAVEIGVFRRTVPKAIAWRTHTDTTVIERLLVERVVVGSSREPASEEDRALREVAQLDAAVVAREPLYLLETYAAMQSTDAKALDDANRRWDPINRCVGALRNELRAVAQALERLLRLLELATTSEGDILQQRPS